MVDPLHLFLLYLDTQYKFHWWLIHGRFHQTCSSPDFYEPMRKAFELERSWWEDGTLRIVIDFCNH